MLCDYLLIQLTIIISIFIVVLIFCLLSSDSLASMVSFSIYSLLIIPLFIVLYNIRLVIKYNEIFGKEILIIISKFTIFIVILIGIILFIELIITFFFSQNYHPIRGRILIIEIKKHIISKISPIINKKFLFFNEIVAKK